MSTEPQVQESPPPRAELVHVQPTEGAAISAFASEGNFTAAQRMARALAASSLVPKAYQGNLPNVLIAMELAHRIGCSVLMCMQQLDVIHERPSWRSQFLIATVNSCGRFEPMDFQFQGEEGKDSWGCRAVATERASGKDRRGPLVTIAIAKAEGWYARNGSKWKTLPELMLIYRAAAFWTRVYAPELSLGMHTSDEVTDMGLAPPPELLGSRTAALAERLKAAQASSAAVAEADQLGPQVTLLDAETCADLRALALQEGVSMPEIEEQLFAGPLEDQAASREADIVAEIKRRAKGEA